MLILEQSQYTAFAGSDEELLKDMAIIYDGVSILLAYMG